MKTTSRLTLRCSGLLAGALLLTATGGAQTAGTSHGQFRLKSIDYGLTWSPEHSKVADTSCQCFSFDGFSMNANFNFFHDWGATADYTYDVANQVENGVNVKKVTFAFGPRYTRSFSEWRKMKDMKHPPQFYGQLLLGPSHAYDSLFLNPNGTTSTKANSLSLQTGGGLDLPIKYNFGLRLLELDYVRTTFPNNYNNNQNDLKISMGLTYRFVRKEPAQASPKP